MNKFAIVTDSASDIPPEIAGRMGIRVIPGFINVRRGGTSGMAERNAKRYLDAVRKAKRSSRTLMASPIDYLDAYQSLAAQGYTDILSIHISGSLSSTVDFPRYLARSIFDDVRIEVVDSLTATVAEGAMALEAAAIAAAGGTIDDALARVFAIRDSIQILIASRNLDRHTGGGNVTALQATGPSLLKMCPVIGFDRSGGLQVSHNAHGLRRAARLIAEDLAMRERERGARVYFMLHAGASRALEHLEREVCTHGVRGPFGGRREIGQCIAACVGEGSFGVVSYPVELHCSELLSDGLLS